MGLFSKKKIEEFKDSKLFDTLSSLTQLRSASNRNRFKNTYLDYSELIAMYKTGTANKIFRMKTGMALSDSINFDTEESEKFYKSRIEKAVKEACMYQLGFGRGIVVIHEKGAVLSQPLKDNWNKGNFKLDVFSGDMITASDVSLDLDDTRYYKPKYYTVRGHQIHWTRVADFTYIKPVEQDQPQYQYGGISESEMIYNQLVNDGVIERASASIVEKNSNMFYKVKDFKQLIMQGKQNDVIKYISAMENNRSIYGAGIVDGDDEAFQVSQALTNLKEVDDVSLRRLAFVTGIPVSILVGENNKGLNSTGDNDQKTLNDTIQAYQEFYIIDPLNELLERLGQPRITFKERQSRTPLEDANYEKTVLGNALLLAQMGEDFNSYLSEKGITKVDDYEDLFGKE